MEDQIERQRTHLQRRKISAAIKLERIQRFVGEESVKVEVIEELEREYDTTHRQLRELEISNEARKKREIQTLKRFGVMDSSALSGIRYSLPDIEISRIRTHSSSVSGSNHHHQPEGAVSDDEEGPDEAEEEEEDPYRKKRSWKALGWLSASPIFFRPRSRSETPSRKYRAMSAGGVAASPASTTVLSLRRLYTGKSEFYDVDDEVVVSAGAGLTYKASSERNIREDVPVKSPIDQKTLDEINRFEILIKNYFLRKQQQKRY